MNVPHKYGLLRGIAFVLKLLGWIVLIAGLFGSVSLFMIAVVNRAGAAALLPAAVGAAGVGVVALLGIIWFVQLYAFGSILSLLVDIEENTRAMAQR
jgi:hypothetical protein